MKNYRTGVANDVDNVIKTNQEPRRWDFLDDYLSGKNKKIKILDVGCGTGSVMLPLIKDGFKDISGMEYNLKVFKAMLKKHPELKIKEGNAEDLKDYKSGTYDLVYCYHVLEHVPFPEKAISEVKRVLKKGGTYIIGIPNGYHLDDELLRLIKIISYGNCDHIQRFNLEKITTLLKKNSFKIKKVSTVKGSLELLNDHRIKFSKYSRVLYKIVRKIYLGDMYFNILAVKE